MKTTLLYLVLVGLPVLGVGVVLRIGQGIQPPVSYGGEWVVEVRPDSTCGRRQELDTLYMTVEQSGPRLEIRFRQGVTLSGRVNNGALHAAGATLGLQGLLRPDTTRHQFDGVISGAPCSGASSRAVATRLNRITGR